jgi:4-hydroxybenzoate polyprenyltransferase
MIGILQGIAIFCLLLLGSELSLNGFYYLGLILALGLMVYQHWLIRARDRAGCFAGFINSHWVGLAVWLGLVLSYL